jgi:hypothetical protein
MKTEELPLSGPWNSWLGCKKNLQPKRTSWTTRQRTSGLGSETKFAHVSLETEAKQDVGYHDMSCPTSNSHHQNLHRDFLTADTGSAIAFAISTKRSKAATISLSWHFISRPAS